MHGGHITRASIRQARIPRGTELRGLKQKAQGTGYKSAEDMLNKASALFKNLTDQWIATHPQGEAFALRQQSIKAINEKHFGKASAKTSTDTIYGTGKTESQQGSSSGEPRGDEGDHLQTALDVSRRYYGSAQALGGGIPAPKNAEKFRAIHRGLIVLE